MNECSGCGQKFDYDPKYHKCPGQWEAECAAAGVPPLDRSNEDETWVEECMRKQGTPVKR